MTEDIPFIKLLRTYNNFYCYDVNKNEIINIEKDTYKYLKNMLHKSDSNIILNDCIKNKIYELINNGYLDANRAKKLEHPLSSSIPILINRNLKSIILQLTQNCNFRCKYCGYTENTGIQRNHSSKSMSYETAKKAIDFLFEHSIDSDDVNIGFYGGEPLLKFDLIKAIVNYAEKKFYGKFISYNMTTNASLLTDEMIKFIVKYNISLMISLDGPKEINDKNRVFAVGDGSVYDKVYSVLRLIKTKYPDFLEQIVVNMVIDPKFDVEKTINMINNDEVFQIVKIRIAPLDDSENIRKKEYSKEYIYKDRYNKFICNLAVLGRYRKNKISKFYNGYIKDFYDNQKLDVTSKINDITAPAGPCVAGHNKLLINVDGVFLPCEKVHEKSESMMIGNLDDGFNIDKIYKALNLSQQTEEICKNCWAFRYCNICEAMADDGSKLSVAKKLKDCEASKLSAYNKLMDKLLYDEYNECHEVKTNE